MKPAVSRSTCIAFLTSAVLAAAAPGLRWIHPIPPVIADRELAALIAEREKLQGNGDVVREALRRKAQELGKAWSAERFAGLQQQLGPEWRWTEMAASASRWREYRLNRASIELAEWPVVAAVSQLEKHPDLAITGLEISASGEGARRCFSLLEITLRLRWTEGNTERAGMSRPFPVSSPAVPGTEAGRRAVPRATVRPPPSAASHPPSRQTPAPGPVCARPVPTTRQSRPFF